MHDAQRARKRRKRASGEHAVGRRSSGNARTPGALALRSVLAQHDLTMTELATVVGVHPTAAFRWLYGARPSRGVALRMAEAWPDIITIGLWGYE